MPSTFKRRGHKFGAVRTTYNGYSYDSKFEAGWAANLDLLQRAGEIQSWERQFRIEVGQHAPNGRFIHTLRHKVDFRILENDGTYTLLEAKGLETQDWKMRKMWLEKAWLPDHPDHRYQVVKPRQHYMGCRA